VTKSDKSDSLVALGNHQKRKKMKKKIWSAFLAWEITEKSKKLKKKLERGFLPMNFVL